MKLSVLIPMYNASKYIRYCIESLVNQDLSKNEYEVIVLDDGSTDDSFEIVSKYAEMYENIVLHSQKNVGESSTRNKLLTMATGEYIYNFDADDYIVHNSLGKILAIASSADADIIGFNTLETNDLNITNFEEQNFKVKTQTGLNYIENNHNFRNEVWWYFIKRSFFEKTKVRFGKNEFNSDVVFTLELLIKAKNFVFYPASIHRYVQTPDSVMRNSDYKKKIMQTENMFVAILGISKFINNLVLENPNYYKKAVANLKSRRDKLSFFTLIKMIRVNPDVKALKHKIQELKINQAYPITHLVGKQEYNSFVYKFLNGLINKEKILYSVVWMFSVLPLNRFIK